MNIIKIISFDLYQTLTTADFINCVWHQAIPSLYAARNHLAFTEARTIVEAEYAGVSDKTLDWYDIRYWVNRFQLGNHEIVLECCRDKVALYPETVEVLSSLNAEYPLIIASSMPREFMPPILTGINHLFTRIFSSFSDYRQLKTVEFYKAVCQELHVRPQEILHTGDDWEEDFIIPQKIGIHAVHLDRTGQPGPSSITDLCQLKARLADT